MIVLVLLIVSVPTAAGQLVETQGKVARDQVYSTVGGRNLTLDLYVPHNVKAVDKLPVVVWIHGGAWRTGSKDRCPAVPLLNRGFVVASISYRLSQEAIFPAQIHDCKAAIRWLRANAGRFPIDRDRIGVWGASAGGHLAALLGTSGDVKELEGGPDNLNYSSRVQAVCDYFGPIDFLRMNDEPGAMDHNAADSPESALIGGPIQANPEKVARANPMTYASSDDPPVLILHGDQDRTVLPSQSQLLHDALKNVGVKVRLGIVKGQGHGFTNSVDQTAFQFFEQTLKGEAK
ncbi:MAG: alpha/beta hydrolase [Acidobacteria bacterium]|nr:MAG: alpha/beta hydrolase [Acidobacteriota bacterium]